MTRIVPREPAWWAAYLGFLVNGMGVVALGPLLPLLLAAWRLSDAAGGALLAAQFVGQCLGSTLVSREPRQTLAAGAACAFAGMSSLAWLLYAGLGVAAVRPLAWVALLVYGFGLGQVITTLNLGVGAGAKDRAARIATGNGFWSVGAILAPLLVAVVYRHGRLSLWLFGFALSFALFWVGLAPLWVEAQGSREVQAVPYRASAAVVLLFAGLVFFYGGAEACLSGWVTTFARRAGATAAHSPLSTSAFWCGIALGRIVAGRLLGEGRERKVLLMLLAGAVVASMGLVCSQSLAAIAAWAGMCGLLLGPVFALLVAGTIAAGTSPRQAGLVLAMSGLGGAAMLGLLGAVSERVGSLREALVLPALCLVGAMLLVGVPSKAYAFR